MLFKRRVVILRDRQNKYRVHGSSYGPSIFHKSCINKPNNDKSKIKLGNSRTSEIYLGKERVSDSKILNIYSSYQSGCFNLKILLIYFITHVFNMYYNHSSHKQHHLIPLNIQFLIHIYYVNQSLEDLHLHNSRKT